MPASRAYLISFLALQYELSHERFEARFPTPWLVWEPGSWMVPADAARAATTATVTVSRPLAPQKGDALCFDVALADGAELKVGRLPACTIVVNDATVSREQLVIARTGETYTVALAKGAHPCTLNGVALAEKPRPLADGDALVAGQVTLAFHLPAAFRQRLAAIAPK